MVTLCSTWLPPMGLCPSSADPAWVSHRTKASEHCSNTALSWGATLQVLLQHSPQTAAPSDILLMLIECVLQKTLCMSPFDYFFAYFSHIRRKKKKKKKWMKLVMFPQIPWKKEISVRVEENYQNHRKKNKQKTIVQIIQPWALPETSVVPSSWDKQAFICVFSISLGISLGILATAVKSWSIYRLAHSVLTKSNILLKAIKIISELKHSLDHGW